MPFSGPNYDPKNNYWTIAGDASRAWSSAATVYVPASDAGFAAWLAAGHYPTPIASEAELAEVLRGLGLAVPPPQVDLRAYVASARYTKETAGITVNGAPIATDRDSQALITGAYSYVLAKPDATINFKSTSGFVTLTADQIQAIALAVGGHVQACFAAEAQVSADIASGKVKTTADVDVAFAAVTD